ncbi:MAG: GerW family sporulation protein [Oscillospiraceae bacterium]|nr:GerW family sporulation protein [Oscillospiraceae bacterium]
MENNSLGELMGITMEKLREMVDVNTIVGKPISTDDGITLIPVSKVSFGFASGGSDFPTKNQTSGQKNAFGGGGGAGVKIDPVAFIVIKDGFVRMISANPAYASPLEKAIEMAPGIIDKVKEIIPNKKDEDTEL